MESRTPYLDAIQKIPGSTAKEKYQSLNKIIKETIESQQVPGDFAPQTSYGSPIPPRLRPLIQIEIAKVLKSTDNVIKALKSDDFSIVSRALKAKWIFDGSNRTVTNFSYYATHILPEVSLITRSLIIKRLSQYLGQRNEYSLAQEFFEGLSRIYNLNQALPLLTACEEKYISELTKYGTMNLPTKVVRRIFLKYPEPMIRYLKFCKPESSHERSVTPIMISDYLDLLPRLVPNYIDDFTDIVNSFENALKIKLGKKTSELFLKSKGLLFLIEYPQKYLPLMSLKLVTKKLSIKEFELMFQNLFPKNRKSFNFNKMRMYLKFQPEERHVLLISKVFKNVYGEDLVSCLDCVTSELLLILPEKKRIDLVQKLITQDEDCKFGSCKTLWIAYLSTKDSIPLIKDEISKSKEVDARASLVSKLIYTCKVNKSESHLLHVLKYIASRHCNEISTFWCTVYDSLLTNFELQDLSEHHWKLLNELIQRSLAKDEVNHRSILQKLLEKNIHYLLLNNLPIEESICLLAEMKIMAWNSKFNIIVNNPKYDKVCLETFIKVIPAEFPDDDIIWADNLVDTVQKLTEGLYNYNERVTAAAKKSNENLNSGELLSVMKYPWLFEKVKSIVCRPYIICEKRREYKVDDLKMLLKKNEPSLYESWFPQKETKAYVNGKEGLHLLKTQPQKIMTNWKHYVKSCKKHIHFPYTKRFLRKCIWYNEIPIKFAEECLDDLSEEDSGALMILAFLLQGPEFDKVVEPLLPKSLKMDIKGKDAKKSFYRIKSIPRAFNQVNPPPSLKTVGKLLGGDYLSLGLISLINVSRRTPVNKVIIFAKSLMEKPISVKKHGIRLMCEVSQTQRLHEFLINLWRNVNHLTIRDIVFQHIYILFTKHPSEETWLLMSACIKDLTEIDVECFKKLVEIENVPNKYMEDYYETGLTKIEQLAEKGLQESVSDQLINSFLRKATSDVCALFSEDYCRSLVKSYAFKCIAGRLYTIERFLIQAGEDKLDSRLDYFHTLLTAAISKDWNSTDPKNFKIYPMRKCFEKIIKHIVSSEMIIKIDLRILQCMLKIFSSILSPTQAFESYLILIFVIELRKAEFDGTIFGLVIGSYLSILVKTFTSEMIVDIAYELSDFLSSSILNSPLVGENFIVSIIESLLDINSIHSSIVVATVLCDNYKWIPDENYKEIVKKLQDNDNPAVATLLNKHILSLN